MVNGGNQVATSPVAQLRERTSGQHRQLEDAVNWPASFHSLYTYRDLLRAFWSIVPELDSRIADRLALMPPDYAPTQRRQWLAQDLAMLDQMLRSASASDSLPRLAPCDFEYLRSESSCIGALYVLEGSSLGGQYLAHQVRSRLQLDPQAGTSYFSGRGSATRLHWQSFCDWTNDRLQALGGINEAVSAAATTFSCFEKALTGRSL